MQGLWNRLNHKLRHQVYLRVLPVVALSVLLVGAVGWVVFTHNATSHRADARSHEIDDLLDRLVLELVKETLSREANPEVTEPSGPVAGTVYIAHDGAEGPRLETGTELAGLSQATAR